MNRSYALFLLLPLLVLLMACANPAADKAKAVTADAAPVPQNSQSGQRFEINPTTSKIEFVGSQVTGSHNGSFQKFAGQIDFTGKPETSRVSVNIEMSSVNADDPKLTAHLKSSDFFDAAKFPQATFVSTEIKAGGEKGATHTVTGNLQLHGVTKSITFPASIVIDPDGVSVDSTFAINRRDFGINYAGAADNLIRDEVVLKLNIKGLKSS